MKAYFITNKYRTRLLSVNTHCWKSFRQVKQMSLGEISSFSFRTAGSRERTIEAIRKDDFYEHTSFPLFNWREELVEVDMDIKIFDGWVV